MTYTFTDPHSPSLSTCTPHLACPLQRGWARYRVTASFLGAGQERGGGSEGHGGGRHPLPDLKPRRAGVKFFLPAPPTPPSSFPAWRVLPLPSHCQRKGHTCWGSEPICRHGPSCPRPCLPGKGQQGRVLNRWRRPPAPGRWHRRHHGGPHGSSRPVSPSL